MAEKRICIVGFSDTSRDLAPFQDERFEIWGCNHLFRFIPRWDVWFELHSTKQLSAIYGDNWEEYADWLNQQTKPIYMREPEPDVPSSVRFPIEKIRERFHLQQESGRNGMRSTAPYPSFKSTIAYMLALAILQEPVEIRLYGVDMILDSEWGFQRHNVYLLLGWARGVGIDVVIPAESALLKEGGFQLYAYDHKIDQYADAIKAMRRQAIGYSKQRAELLSKQDALVDQITAASAVANELFHLAHTDTFEPNQKWLLDRRDLLMAEAKRMEAENEKAISELHHIDGRHEEVVQWMERFGFNDRGEQFF